jgi:DNA-binding winged helix-turn-helix (wHTH) protein
MAGGSTFTLPRDELKRLVGPAFKLLGKGSSVTLIGAPGTGKTGIIRFILANPKILKTFLPGYPAKHLIVYLDPSEVLEKTPSALYGILIEELLATTRPFKDLNQELRQTWDQHQSLRPTGATVFHLAKEMVSAIVDDHGLNLTIIIDDFELLLDFPATTFSSLAALRRINNQQITFLLLGRKLPSPEAALEKFGDFYKVVFNKIIPLPLYSPAAARATIKHWAKIFKGKLTNDAIQTILEVCGGHGACLKYATRRACLDGSLKSDELKEILLGAPDLRLNIQAIWTCLSDSQKNLLAKALEAGSLSRRDEKELKLVFDCGLLTREGDRIKPFGEILPAFLSQKQSGFQTLAYNQENGEVLVNGVPASDTLTAQEYNLLTFLVKNQNHVCTRDEIATTLWGGKYHEKYSDWAIDRLMSRLRRKLDLPPKNPYLITIRGRGYKPILPAR